MKWPFVSCKKYDRLKAEHDWMNSLLKHYHQVVERQDFEITHNRNGKGRFVSARLKVVK
jgi:hypothetical protein